MLTKKRLFFIFLISCQTFGAHLLDAKKLLVPKEKKDEFLEQLEHLKEEVQKTQDTPTQEKQRQIQEALNQIDKKINTTKVHLKTAINSDLEFLNKKLSLLNEQYQTLFNIQFTHKEMINNLEQNIKLLEDYQKDPTFKSLTIEPQAVYSYDDVQKEVKKVFAQEEKIKSLNNQKKDEVVELQNQEKKLLAALKNYQDKKKEQEDFASKVSSGVYQEGELNFKQRGELLDLGEQLAAYQKQLAEMRVLTAQRKNTLLSTNILLENDHLNVLKQNLTRSKAGLRISEADLNQMKNALEKRKQKSLLIKEALEDIKRLSSIKERLLKDIEDLKIKYKIPTEKDIDWYASGSHAENFASICEIGDKKTQVQVVDKKIEYLRALIQLEEVKARREEIRFMIMTLWYNLSHHVLSRTDEIATELKQFKDIEAEIEREVSALQDKKHALNTNMELLNKELTTLRSFSQNVQESRDSVFHNPLRYGWCLSKMIDAEKNVTEQVDITNKLMEVYNEAIGIYSSALKEDSIIINELETKSIWQRSQYAISWEGIKNILPDLQKFFYETKQIAQTYFASMALIDFFKQIVEFFATPKKLLILLTFIIASMVLAWFAFTPLKIIIQWLFHQRNTTTFSHMMFIALGCLLGFIRRYFLLLFIWFVLGIIIYLNIVPELFPRILFNLCSIPFLMILSYRFIRQFIECNRAQEYAVFQESFEKRFSFVFSFFAYLSIIVFFLREAFILATVHKSEFPNILLAIYSIVLRILIIFSIGKEEVLSMLNRPGGLWHWLSEIIDRFYYILLLAIISIMILSDPYVGGYRNLVSYIIWGIIGTLVVLRILYALHTYLKKYSEVIFFDIDDEIRRERFAYAKTAYGIFVILLFILFIIIAGLIAIHIWGLQIKFEEIWKYIDYHLFSTGIEKGEHIWFTPRKFIALISFIISGFVAAAFFNRLVLQRIFSVLPVDLGVQNTILSITRYLTVVIAIYFGFQLAGLGNLLIAISIVVGSISYILKEPVGDFISYFIILVQRPIQIGDFIMISDEVYGVVRKITPRSIILRKKDSYSIILPNSTILVSPVSNWSYARNFIAFDDLEFTIGYGVDPFKIRKIISKVLDENIEILKTPKPIIRLDNFSENGYVFMVRGFISNINILRQWDIASDIRFSLVKALSEENIKLAIPTRVLMHDEGKIEIKTIRESSSQQVK